MYWISLIFKPCLLLEMSFIRLLALGATMPRDNLYLSGSSAVRRRSQGKTELPNLHCQTQKSSCSLETSSTDLIYHGADGMPECRNAYLALLEYQVEFNVDEPSGTTISLCERSCSVYEESFIAQD